MPKTAHEHGPQNADHAIRVAYNEIIGIGVTYFWDRRPPSGVHPDEMFTLYKHAFHLHREGKLLAAERCARAAKHLARALCHEARIAYFEPHSTDLPFLEHATDEELSVHAHSDTVEDLLNSLQDHVPPGMTEMPEDMKLYISRAKKHLSVSRDQNYKHELLLAERINAAYEYARTVECLALAYEANSGDRAREAA